MALVMTVAMLPSMTLSKVDGIPKGRKLSAVGPILALGIHAWTEHGGGTADRHMSSKMHGHGFSGSCRVQPPCSIGYAVRPRGRVICG